jgi:hypothetical protein
MIEQFPIVVTAALVVCALLAALAVFQGALIAGAPIGYLAWGGQDRVLPTGKRIGSVVSVILYAAFALVVLQRGGILGLSAWQGFAEVAIWVLAAYFTLGILMNGISRSKPERWTMAPLCALLALLTFVIAAS